MQIRQVVAIILAALAGASARRADAACNLIPGTTKTFSGTLGTTNRPFAAPGETIEVAVRGCDAISTGLLATAGDHVVSFVFTPPAPAKPSLVVLAADCSALTAQLDACHTSRVLNAVCKTATVPADLDLVGDVSDRRLRVRFPDTDAELAPSGDGHPLAGPVTIAVTGVGDPPPCGLLTAKCTAVDGTLACIDDLFVDDGHCGHATRLPVFRHLTALPPPNDYAAVCYADAPCTASVNELRAALDATATSWRR